MTPNDLKEILNERFIFDDCKTLLIDGPWGIGKTTCVKDTIKSKNNLFFYISLFGKKTVDEVNTEVYKQVHRNKWKWKNAFKMGLKIIPWVLTPFEILIPGINGVSNKVKNIGEIQSNKKIERKNIIIIFDDLERVNKSFSYIEFLGYLSALIENDIKIICVGSLDNMKTDDITKTEFNEFCEKLFDRFLNINKVDDDTLKLILNNSSNNSNISNYENIKEASNNNLRIVQKSLIIYKKLLNLVNNDISEYDISENELFVLCIKAIKISLLHSNDGNSNTANVAGITDTKKYNKAIYNALSKENKFDVFTFSKNNFFSNEKFLFLESIVDYIVNNSCESFCNLLNVRKENKNFILQNSFWFLSKSNKKKYINLFAKKIKSTTNLLGNNVYRNKFEEIIHYGGNCFNDKEIEKLSKKIVNDWLNIDSEYNGQSIVEKLIFSSYFHFNSPNANENIKKWTTSLKSAEEKREYIIFMKNIKNVTTREKLLNYNFLNNALIFNYIKKNYSLIINNLNGDLSQKDWYFYLNFVDKLIMYNQKAKSEILDFLSDLEKNKNNEEITSRINVIRNTINKYMDCNEPKK